MDGRARARTYIGILYCPKGCGCCGNGYLRATTGQTHAAPYSSNAGRGKIDRRKRASASITIMSMESRHSGRGERRASAGRDNHFTHEVPCGNRHGLNSSKLQTAGHNALATLCRIMACECGDVRSDGSCCRGGCLDSQVRPRAQSCNGRGCVRCYGLRRWRGKFKLKRRLVMDRKGRRWHRKAVAVRRGQERRHNYGATGTRDHRLHC